MGVRTKRTIEVELSTPPSRATANQRNEVAGLVAPLLLKVTAGQQNQTSGKSRTCSVD